MLNMFIGNYSGNCKFSFGILHILIHIFTLYMQGKWGNQKRANSATHILAFKYYVQLIIARHIIHVVDLISTQNV